MDALARAQMQAGGHLRVETGGDRQQLAAARARHQQQLLPVLLVASVNNKDTATFSPSCNLHAERCCCSKTGSPMLLRLSLPELQREGNSLLQAEETLKGESRALDSTLASDSCLLPLSLISGYLQQQKACETQANSYSTATCSSRPYLKGWSVLGSCRIASHTLFAAAYEAPNYTRDWRCAFSACDRCVSSWRLNNNSSSSSTSSSGSISSSNSSSSRSSTSSSSTTRSRTSSSSSTGSSSTSRSSTSSTSSSSSSSSSTSRSSSSSTCSSSTGSSSTSRSSTSSTSSGSISSTSSSSSEDGFML
ncbi:hypothetical protein Emag_003527 [Eimeria magna]